MRIVPAFDEGKHRLAGILGRMEGFSIQQFTFQGSEEALAQGIIETVANSTHGRSDASFSTALPERKRGVLAALIGMMNNALWTALPDCHRQRIEHQLGAQVSGHGPTHHPAAPGVQDHCQIQPAGPGSDIGNVGHPEFVRAVGVEVALDQVGGGAGICLPQGGAITLASADALDFSPSHQPCHPFTTHVNPFLGQFGMDTRCAIGAFGASVDFFDPLGQGLIFLRPPGGRPLQPRIIPAGGDFQHSAHRGDRILLLVRFHELKDLSGIETVS